MQISSSSAIHQRWCRIESDELARDRSGQGSTYMHDNKNMPDVPAKYEVRDNLDKEVVALRRELLDLLIALKINFLR